MQDLVDILSAMVARKAAVADARELLLDVGDRIVRRVAGAFGVKADEVAILRPEAMGPKAGKYDTVNYDMIPELEAGPIMVEERV